MTTRSTLRPPPAAELTAVTKRYGDVLALDRVDLVLERGRATALLGPNGAGKTTCVKLLLGLVRPSAGRVEVFGGDPRAAAQVRGSRSRCRCGRRARPAAAARRPHERGRAAPGRRPRGRIGAPRPPAAAAAAMIRIVIAEDQALVLGALAAEAWTEPDPLTDRERQVVRLAGEGLSTSRIAGELHLSEGTVRNYLSEAIGKLGAGNRVEAARIAREKGWL